MNDNEHIKLFVRLCRNAVIDYVKDAYGTQIERSDVLLFITITDSEKQIVEALAQVNLFDGMYFRLTFNIKKKELSVNVYKKADDFSGSLTAEDADTLTNFIPKE